MIEARSTGTATSAAAARRRGSGRDREQEGEHRHVAAPARAVRGDRGVRARAPRRRPPRGAARCWRDVRSASSGRATQREQDQRGGEGHGVCAGWLPSLTSSGHVLAPRRSTCTSMCSPGCLAGDEPRHVGGVDDALAVELGDHVALLHARPCRPGRRATDVLDLGARAAGRRSDRSSTRRGRRARSVAPLLEPRDDLAHGVRGHGEADADVARRAAARWRSASSRRSRAPRCRAAGRRSCRG